ncbi:MAG: hypothetical protein ABI197_01995 [Granulicella sp.]
MAKAQWIVTLMTVICLLGAAGKSFAAVDNVSGACASTPAAALQAARNATVAAAPGLAGAHGFRVASVRWDSIERRNWAVIESCDHSDRPPVVVAMDAPAPALPAATVTRPYTSLPLVRAGDIVRLWKNDRMAHLEIIGIAEENGAAGAHVRVRLAASKDAEGQVVQPRYFAGIVRGPANVEMEP